MIVNERGVFFLFFFRLHLFLGRSVLRNLVTNNSVSPGLHKRANGPLEQIRATKAKHVTVLSKGTGARAQPTSWRSKFLPPVAFPALRDTSEIEHTAGQPSAVVPPRWHLCLLSSRAVPPPGEWKRGLVCKLQRVGVSDVLIGSLGTVTFAVFQVTARRSIVGSRWKKPFVHDSIAQGP